MKIFYLFLSIVVIVQNLFGLGNPVIEAKEIVGCWKRNIYSDRQMKRLSLFDFYDPVHQKFQWFCFEEDGTFRTMTASRDMPFDEIFQIAKLSQPRMTWKMIAPGVVRIEHKDDPKQNFNWLVSIASKQENFKNVKVKPNELCMGLINEDGTDYVLLRVLSKVQ